MLLNRVKMSPAEPGQPEAAADKQGFFIIPFEGAFHGRTLGSLAATHKRKARLGFPTFDWPHVLFPVEDPRSKWRTQRRDEKSLEQVWTLLVTGRVTGAPRPLEQFKRQLKACDELLARLPADRAAWPAMVQQFVELQRALIDPAVLKRAQRVAGVLVEPIQCEGGLKFASASFFQRLRLLTRIYDVPLMFDEVQTGWGATGQLWAHELFDLPCPPDVVVWAKKAQNGVLFVSEDLATFFQEEKKFNTTWEGDSVGMVRLLGYLDRLDLEQVRRTGALAREGLEQLARDYKDLLQNVRGQGCLLAFDVVRADWREWLRERAFRNGLILLPAGERTLRFYPRYDMEPSAIHEALAHPAPRRDRADRRAGPGQRGRRPRGAPRRHRRAARDARDRRPERPGRQAAHAAGARARGRAVRLQRRPPAAAPVPGRDAGGDARPPARRRRRAARPGLRPAGRLRHRQPAGEPRRARASATTRTTATTTPSTCRPWPSRPS